MSRTSDACAPATPFVLVLAPDGARDLAVQVRSGLARVANDEVIIDLHRVDAVDPALLRALRTVAEDLPPGRVALTGATPEVHKALHVAGVAALFRRV